MDEKIATFHELILTKMKYSVTLGKTNEGIQIIIIGILL
jgi:hypothetical protein